VFSNGQQVTLAGNFTDITAGVTAGTEFTSVPPIPGRPDDTNPPFQRMMTGQPPSPPNFLAAGTLVAALDLGNITVTNATTLGLADLKQNGVFYTLQLRDASLAVLPVTGIVVTPYNVSYTGGLIADLNTVLNTTTEPGKLTNDNTHDAGGSYSHTGLTTFSNLPAGTRYISLYAGFDTQEIEGISVFLANELAAGVQITDSEGGAGDQLVAFGNTTVGTLGVHTVTVTNFTAGAVTVGITDSLAPPFGIADPGDCTITLQPSEECTITVTYQPVNTSLSEDSLTFDVDGTSEIVTVSGTGTTPTITVADSIGDTSDHKLLFGSTVTAGSTGTGTVTITNTDTVAVTLDLTDDLAAPYSFIGASCDGVTLMMNQSCTATIQFAPLVAGVFDDSITYDAGGTLVTIELNGTPGLANADFDVTTSASNPVVQPGVAGSDQTTITITIGNIGPDAGDSVVTYLLPPGATLLGAAPGQGSYDPDTGQWTTGPIASGGSVTLELTIQAGAGVASCLANSASATAGSGTVDQTTTNNNSTTYVAAPACADLEFGASAVNDRFVGDILTPIRAIDILHTIDVRNRGPGPATGVLLTLTGYSFSNPDAIAGDIPVVGTVINVGGLASGETKTFTIADYQVSNVTGVQGIDVVWSTSVAGNEPDPDPASNTDSGAYTVSRSGGGTGGNCFIATAAFGSYLEPEVMALRHFRDRYLLTTAAGRAFVAWYYRVSPAVASEIRQREWLRTLTRGALTPMVYAIKYPGNMGLLLLALLMAPIALRVRASRAPGGS